MGAARGETGFARPGLADTFAGPGGKQSVVWCNEGRGVSWDRKRRGAAKGYYYRSVRKGGRTMKVYVGGGVIGETAALADLRRREIKRAVRQEETRLAAADEVLDELKDWAT